MKIVICDDDRAFAAELSENIRRILAHGGTEHAPCVPVYFDTPLDALSYIENNRVDILFLDISMPGMSGFDVARLAQASRPELLLIFVSGQEQQVFYSMRFSPFRFLRKSTYESELGEALHSAKAKLAAKNEHVCLGRDGRITAARSRIMYAQKEKQKNYLSVTLDSETLRVRMTMRELDGVLRGKGFFRISSGVIVGFAHIARLESDGLMMVDGTFFPVSRTLRSPLRAEYIRYMRNR